MPNSSHNVLGTEPQVHLKTVDYIVMAVYLAGLIGLEKVSEAVRGWGRWETFALAIPIIFAYVFMSGYMGVVVSDVIQTSIMIIASLVLFFVVWIDFGGPSGLYRTLLDQFGAEVVS